MVPKSLVSRLALSLVILFVTVTTKKDPGKMKRGCHQVEVFTFVNYDAFERWHNQTSGERDAEYKQLKKKKK